MEVEELACVAYLCSKVLRKRKKKKEVLGAHTTI
jgi:hypothetical protein